MNKQIFDGQWNQVKGKIQEQWGELTDDELDKIAGDNQQIYGFLQKHYGFAKDAAAAKVNEFARALSSETNELRGQISHLRDDLKNLSARGGQVVVGRVKENPLLSVGIAVSAGVILGWLFGRK